MDYDIVRGFPEDQREVATHLFWQAFHEKLGKILGPEEKALELINRMLDPHYAISAVSKEGTLLGMAGYKTSKGAFAEGGFSDLLGVYGLWGSLWRTPLAWLLERETEAGVLLMDGIFVSAEARGLGIGTALLDAIADIAREKELERVRLDVIDTNPRARALYERSGFKCTGTEETWPFGWLFGFSSSAHMEKTVSVV